MKKAFVFVFVLACSATQAQVNTTVTDGAKCAGDLIGDFAGMLNIAGTLVDCGMTIDDLINIIMQKQAALPDGGVGASPEAVQLQKLLDAAKAYKVSHPNG
jgi:hypothetical protein